MPTHKRTTNFINSVSKSIRGYLLICTWVSGSSRVKTYGSVEHALFQSLAD
jgi:hypothetical protein